MKTRKRDIPHFKAGTSLDIKEGRKGRMDEWMMKEIADSELFYSLIPQEATDDFALAFSNAVKD